MPTLGDLAARKAQGNTLASLKAGAEILANLGTGSLASLGGGLAYLGALPFGGDAAGQAVKKAVEESLTYDPTGKKAREILSAVGSYMAPVTNVTQGFGKNLGDKAYAATDSPLLAAIATAAPQAAMEFADRANLGALKRAPMMRSVDDVQSLRAEVRSLIGEPKNDAEWVEAFSRLTSDQRSRLNHIEGVALPQAERAARVSVRTKAPDSDALNAVYMSPDEVPVDVMNHVRKGSPITQDATDAVRWARIVGTQSQPRLGGGRTTIFRAVNGDEIRPGDWVTTSEQYALDHLRKNLKGKGRVVRMDVDGSDVLLGPTGNYEEAFYAPLSLSGPYKPK